MCFSSFPSNSKARDVLGRPPDVEASSVVPSLHTRFARGGRGVRPTQAGMVVLMIPWLDSEPLCR